MDMETNINTDSEIRNRRVHPDNDIQDAAIGYVYYENTPLGDYLSSIGEDPIVTESPLSSETYAKTLHSSDIPIIYRILGKIYRMVFKSTQFLSKTFKILNDQYQIATPYNTTHLRKEYQDILQQFIQTDLQNRPQTALANTLRHDVGEEQSLGALLARDPWILGCSVLVVLLLKSMFTYIFFGSGVIDFLYFLISVSIAISSLGVIYIRTTNTFRKSAEITLLYQFTHFLTITSHLDSKITKSIRTIQEIELVSRGYKLSSHNTFLPPISRIEKMDPAPTTQRCVMLRQTLNTVLETCTLLLVRGKRQYEDIITRSNIFIDENNGKSHEGEGLVVDAMEDLGTTDTYALEALKSRHLLLKVRRVELLTRMLDDGLLFDRTLLFAKDSRWWNYMLFIRLLTTEIFTPTTRKMETLERTLERALEKELDLDLPSSSSLVSKIPSQPHTPSQSLLTQISSINQSLTSLKSKLYVITQDLHELETLLESRPNEINSPNNETITKLCENLEPTYNSIREDFEIASETYTRSLKNLKQVIHGATSSTNESILPVSNPQLPSPPPECEEDIDMKGANEVMRTVRYEDVFVDDVLDVEEAVFEAMSGSPTQDEPHLAKPKLSREERIQLAKKVREAKLVSESKKMEPIVLVKELKDVLGKRKSRGDLRSASAAAAAHKAEVGSDPLDGQS